MDVNQFSMKILSCNVRGLNDLSMHRRINQFIYSVKAEWIGLPKSKLSSVSDLIVS